MVKRMVKQRLRDPTLYQWIFLISQHSHEENDKRQDHRRGFEAVVREAWDWMGIASSPPSIELPTFPQPRRMRIAGTDDWQKRDGKQWQLDVYILLDAFCLQLSQAQPGEAPPEEAFRSLIPWRPPILQGELVRHAYLGEAVCSCAEVPEGLPENDLRGLAEAVLQQRRGYSAPGPPIESLLLPQSGFLAVLPDAREETFVLLYPGSAAQQAGRFVHAILPLLFLSRLKSRAIERNYMLALSKAQDDEQELDALLKQAAQRHLHLEQLEQLSASISQRQATFIESISSLEEQRQTVQVNLRNIELLLEDPLWGEARQRAWQVLADKAQLLLEQIETGLHYLRITQQQADLALSSLMTIASVRGTQWERRITLLLFAFVVLELAQVFPELTWGWRLGLIGLGLPLGALAYWWLRRR